jgi:hypothetical protein
MRKMSDEIESFPDRFMRRDYLPKLLHVREQLAEIIGASTQEVVLVPNATHGVNNIVTQINWNDGDVIVMCKPPPALVSRRADSKFRRRMGPSRRQ